MSYLPTDAEFQALSDVFEEEGYIEPSDQPKTSYYRPYRPKLNPVQSQGYDKIKQHIFNLLFGERYCIEDGALLYTDGGVKRLRRLRPYPEPGLHPMEREVLSWDGTKTVVEKTSHFFNESSRDAVRLDFNNGNHLTVSPWHPLWCAYKTEDGRHVVGFAEAKSIAFLVQLKRQVYLPLLPYPEFKRSTFVEAAGIRLDEGVGYLLGALCGDGSLNFIHGGSSLGFTNMDEECLARVRSELTRLGAELKFSRKYQYRINKTWKLKPLLAELGMATLSKFKRIPDQIIESPAPVIRQFLRGLYDTDGTVDKVGAVIFSSASEGLSKDVQDCLQALGIFSVRRFTANDKAGCWDVYCMGAEARRFIDEIGFEITRKSNRRLTAKYVNRKAYCYPEFIREEMKKLKKGTACLGVHPNRRRPFKILRVFHKRRFKGTVTWNVSGHIGNVHFCETFPTREEAEMFVAKKELERSKVVGHDRKWHLKHRGVIQCRYVPSPDKLARFKQICGTSAALEALSFTDRWVLVNSATLTEATLCDLKVPRTESFIANGLINHNSGKSVLGVHALVDHCREEQNARALMIVPTGRQGEEGGAWHKLNTFVRWEWEQGGDAIFTEPRQNKYKDTYIWISNKFGGWSRVVLVSMPFEGYVAPRVKGIEPTFVLVDEAQTLETDTYFKHLVQQLGRDPNISHQPIVYTCNPAGRSHWLYKRFFIMPVDEKTGKWNQNYHVLHLPITDNQHNLPKFYWERVMDACKGDETEYRRMILGEWVDAPSGDALFRNEYNENIHVRGDALRNRGLLPVPGLPGILGWDLGAAHSAVTFEQYIPVKEKIYWLIFDETVYIDRYIPYRKMVPILLGRMKYWEERVKVQFKYQHISDSSAFNQYRAKDGSFDYKDIQEISGGKIRMVPAPKGPFSIETRVRLTREKLQENELLLSAICTQSRAALMKLEEDPNNRMRPKTKSRWSHAWDSMSYPWLFYNARGDASMRPQEGEVLAPAVYTA